MPKDLPKDLPTDLSTAVNAGRLWRGTGRARHVQPPLATGHGQLDEALGGGWPTGCLLEFLIRRSGPKVGHEAGHVTGHGELPLLLPALAALTAAGRPVLFIAPPHVPYAPGLARAGLVISRLLVVLPAHFTQGTGRGSRQDTQNILWSMEESLASDTCGAVLAWADDVSQAALRRLHLAAGRGQGLAVLIRSRGSSPGRSPAALRLGLHRDPAGGLSLEFLRNRHGSASTLRLDLAGPAPR